MDSNVMRNIRRASNGSVAAAAICALTGAIGVIITMNFLKSGEFDPDEIKICSILFITFWDLVRLGGFGIFVGGLLSVAFEIFGGDRNKVYSFVLLSGSIFGFIGSIMLSVESILKSVMGSALGLSQSYGYGYGYGSNSRYQLAENLMGSLTSTVTTACVFAIVSAVVAFVAIGIATSAGNNANMYYAQMPGAAGVNSGADGVWYCPHCGAQNSNSTQACKNCFRYK